MPTTINSRPAIRAANQYGMGGRSRPDARPPVHLIAFGFGSSLMRKAPGTWVTLIAIPVTVFVMQFGFAATMLTVPADSAAGGFEDDLLGPGSVRAVPVAGHLQALAEPDG